MRYRGRNADPYSKLAKALRDKCVRAFPDVSIGPVLKSTGNGDYTFEFFGEHIQCNTQGIVVRDRLFEHSDPEQFKKVISFIKQRATEARTAQI